VGSAPSGLSSVFWINPEKTVANKFKKCIRPVLTAAQQRELGVARLFLVDA
jgi:hypothetical protein